MFFALAQRSFCCGASLLQPHLLGDIALNAPSAHQVSVFDDANQAIAEDFAITVNIDFVRLAIQNSKS